MIDLRQLKYFVVVAEEEHVGRAAGAITYLAITAEPPDCTTGRTAGADAV